MSSNDKASEISTALDNLRKQDERTEERVTPQVESPEPSLGGSFINSSEEEPMDLNKLHVVGNQPQAQPQQSVTQFTYKRESHLADLLSAIPLEVATAGISPGIQPGSLTKQTCAQLRAARKHTLYVIERINIALDSYHQMSLRGDWAYDHNQHQKCHIALAREQNLLMHLDMIIQAKASHGDSGGSL